MSDRPQNDPKTFGAQPPFPQETLPYPGLESEMTPLPDYGEDSYEGSGKLKGKAGLITGGDSGIGRAVAPGPVWTPLIAATVPEQQGQTFGQGSQMGRPAELTPTYVFLASDDASFISGQIIGVTSGVPIV